MKARVIFDALAALRAVEDAPAGMVPSHLWIPCMQARIHLEAELVREKLNIEVQKEES